MKNLIYKHTSKTSGKSYIGKTTKTVETRLNEHIRQAKSDKIKTTHFHRALLKYGKEDFETEILEDGIYTNSNDREKYWIKKFDTLDNGYNMTEGGDGSFGYKQTKEHKEKIRKANTGSKRTEEQKKNISESHKGQIPWNKGIQINNSHLQNKIVCPHCEKEGSIGPMKQWHFDYCKSNPNRIKKDQRKKPSEKLETNRKEKMKNLPKVQCPHCLKETSPQGKRWHFDRCRDKKEN